MSAEADLDVQSVQYLDQPDYGKIPLYKTRKLYLLPTQVRKSPAYISHIITPPLAQHNPSFSNLSIHSSITLTILPRPLRKPALSTYHALPSLNIFSSSPSTISTRIINLIIPPLSFTFNPSSHSHGKCRGMLMLCISFQHRWFSLIFVEMQVLITKKPHTSTTYYAIFELRSEKLN